MNGDPNNNNDPSKQDKDEPETGSMMGHATNAFNSAREGLTSFFGNKKQGEENPAMPQAMPTVAPSSATPTSGGRRRRRTMRRGRKGKKAAKRTMHRGRKGKKSAKRGKKAKKSAKRGKTQRRRRR